MGLNKEQTDAENSIHKWMKSSHRDDWLYCLGGFAGVGKTYLMQEFIRKQSETPICMAPTGKAASVLGKKLAGIPVNTIHSVLYQPDPQSYGHLKKLNDFLSELKEKNASDEELEKARNEIKFEKKRLSKEKVSFSIKDADIGPGDLCIVDEASMTTTKMMEDFKKTGAKVLFVGDIGQLPPVGDGGWFLKRKPNFLLQEVQRQALESPIIRLSMDVRNGKTINAKDWSGGLEIKNKKSVGHDEWMMADQIITGKNASRHRMNRFCRKKLEIESGMPVKGDKLICLKNKSVADTNFLNGVQAIADSDAVFDEEWYIDLTYDDHPIEDVAVYDYHCMSHYDNQQIEEPWFNIKHLQEFDYAYAITCHKSQGSEWPFVLLADDGIQSNNKEFRKRWLYTAITRAKEKLLWVQN